MRWCATAPANIALIKYMGKQDATLNTPMNASLSYTLPHLLTKVEIETTTDIEDRWEPLIENDFNAPILSTSAIERFLKHLTFLKKQFDYTGTFIIRSANNFPHGTGLASSASSFAALTKCATQALTELTQQSLPLVTKQTEWSRQGSGSSCRSFYEPWVIWDAEGVYPLELPYSKLDHQVILVEANEKKVSSSEAHRRIHTSPLYGRRKAEAEAHLKTLLHALKTENWTEAYRICWKEFQDMHELFHTASPSFRYITPEAVAILSDLKADWDRQNDGPLVTMDAGPNIHLLYRTDQNNLRLSHKAQFSEHYHVL